MISLKELQRLRTVIAQYAVIPETEWLHFVGLLSKRIFLKNQYLVQEGDIAENIYFIISGLVRFFYKTECGKEFNKHFAHDNGFAGSLYSHLRHAPCGFFIEALEETDTIVLPSHNMFEELYSRHSCWEVFSRKRTEDLLFIKEAREKELLLDSLEVRYNRFIKDNPE